MRRRKRILQDLDQEIREHIEMTTQENLDRGMSPEEARYAALRKFGNVTRVKEDAREVWSFVWVEQLLQDIRFAIRVLCKSPAFTTIAVLTLALGIGANTALFSVVNGVLLHALPYPDPDRLVALYARTPDFIHSTIAYPNFLDWTRDNHSFSALAAFRGDGFNSFNLTGHGEAERLPANMVSASFFPVLGVNPVLGRLFTQQEDQLDSEPVALISEGLWKRKFASSPDVIGTAITLNGTLYTIIGVIPSSFHYENDNFTADAELYLPLGQWNNSLFRDRRTAMGMDAVGRLKPGVTLAQANSDMSAVATHLAEIYPDTNKDSGVTLVALKENLVGDIRPSLLILLAAVGFVLMIACANVANLLLARSTVRIREFAIRTALGASKGRVVRQLLTESVLIALAGGTLGLLLAAWGTKSALKILPEALPRANEIQLDARVLFFTLAASLIAGILFGLVPAFRSSRTEVQETLKESGRGGSGARHRTQSVFVVVEMALAVVLLVGAGLMIRTLSNLWGVDPGFNPHNLLIFNIASTQPFGETPSAIRAIFRQLHDTISSIPGMQAASLTVGSQPMQGDSELQFWLEGESKPASQAEMKQTLFYITQQDYLKAMDIPLKRGRFLQDSDTENTPSVVVIDDHFANLYFSDKDPIGAHINLDVLDKSAEIVGIVGHINQWGLDSDSKHTVQAQCYFPVAQIPDPLMAILSHSTSVVARTAQISALPVNSITLAVQSVNSQMVVYGTESMTGVISNSFADRRFAMILLGMFAALAVILSTLGIYGVISYVVGQRTHEIGIRMALGARHGDVLRMVLNQAGKMVILGLFVGLLASLGLTRLMASMLFGVNSYDPLTFLAVSIMLSFVGLVACYIPAHRATRVDPTIALRYE